jgi:hypothetical protein
MSDNYGLPLHVGSFIAACSADRQYAQRSNSGKRKTIIVGENKDPVLAIIASLRN